MERKSYDELSLHEDVHWWFIARRMIIRRVLDCYLVRRKGRVLEIGCGSGGNLGMLGEYGELSAMELDEQSREAANRRGICEVRRGQLPGEIPYTATFDLICMLDVLEHIEDDAVALHAVREKLNSDGAIVITVPAYMFLWSEHDVVNHHKRRYTKKQLKTLFSAVGLEIDYLTYFNTFLFPVIATLRLLNRLSTKSGKSDLSLPPGWVNKLLLKLFSSETLFLPAVSFPFGVSILAVGRKIP